MPTSVTMPALGESVTEGTVTRWLKQEGEQVEVDEPLLEVSTDKVDTEIPSPAAGVLSKILVAEDETVEVGAELAVIGGDGDGGGAPAPASAEDETTQTPVDQVQDSEPAQEQQPAPAAEAPSGDGRATGGSGGGSARGPDTPVPTPAPGGGRAPPAPRRALGESVPGGPVPRWLKAVGDEVSADEPLLEVSTDKVDTEIPSPVSGTLLSISVNEDETVDVGAELAVIGAAGGAPAAAPAPAPAPAAPEPKAEAPAPAPRQEQPTPVKATTDTGQPGADYGSSGAMPTESPTEQPAPAQAVAPQSQPAAAPAGDGAGAYVTPLVRRLAAGAGGGPSTVRGHRRGG